MQALRDGLIDLRPAPRLARAEAHVDLASDAGVDRLECRARHVTGRWPA